MEIIKALKSHLDEVLEIERKSFGLAWSRDSFVDELRSPDAHFTVCIEDGKVEGFCIARCFDEEAELFNIAVSPDRRRCHIGETLLVEMLRYVRKKGASAVFLEVRESNTAARELYEKQGFRSIGVRHGYYDCPTEDAVLMLREWEDTK